VSLANAGIAHRHIADEKSRVNVSNRVLTRVIVADLLRNQDLMTQSAETSIASRCAF